MISSYKFRHSCSSFFRAAYILVGALAPLVAQQTGEKLVKVNQVAQITDAVLISDVSIAGKPIECGLYVKPPAVVQPFTPFQAGTDWFQQMTISLVNRTSKTIVFGALIFHFLDTGDCRSGPCVGVDLELGQRPAIDAYDQRSGKPLQPEHPERPPLDWKSEQTLVIHVSDYMPDFEGRLANYLPVTNISKVNISRGPFYFEDGMEWSLGKFSVPDPDHHGEFKQLPPNYFPGRTGHNWPPGYNQ